MSAESIGTQGLSIQITLNTSSPLMEQLSAHMRTSIQSGAGLATASPVRATGALPVIRKRHSDESIRFLPPKIFTVCVWRSGQKQNHVTGWMIVSAGRVNNGDLALDVFRGHGLFKANVCSIHMLILALRHSP